MEEQVLNQPEMPAAQEAPIPDMPKKRGFDPRYIFIAMIVIGIGGGIFAFTQRPKEEVVLPTTTPTATPTQAMRDKLPLATSSAYLNLVASVASLSGAIQALEVTDATLVPPQVELQLGFPNQ